MSMTADKVWTKEEIRDRLEQSNVWLERGIVAIYNKQTSVEQGSEQTIEDNGVGFNGRDANYGSSLARQIQLSQRPEGERLSMKQREAGRRMMKKYAGQLARIANRKI